MQMDGFKLLIIVLRECLCCFSLYSRLI